MIVFLRVLRIKNLIFIAFIQFVMHRLLLVPILQTYGFETAMGNCMLSLLIAATVLIAAGGYVLNDYFDVKIDNINRPETTIVGKQISRHTAMVLHQGLNGLGVFLGLLLAYFAHSFTLAFIFIVVPGLLWFYSASYKRQFITGNLVVSFAAALTVLIVGLTQLAFLQKEYGNLIFETPIPKQFYGWVGGYALFSFLCTWIREIIKDMEDEKGDREMECRTMPIKWGTNKTKLFLYGLIVITVSGLFVLNGLFIHFGGLLTFRYILFGLALPYAALCFLIFQAKSPEDYHRASTLSKAIMLIGVLYSFIFYYLQAKTYGISLFNLFIVK
jgi:4-hydroxybenzoate polyprenyltransferase